MLLINKLKTLTPAMQINKSTLSFSRLIHVYVSMALLSLLLFFSVTGITLNHPEWFRDSKADVVERALMIDLSMIKNPPLTPQQIVNVSTAIEQKLSVSLNNTILESSQDELFFSIKRAGKNTAITLDFVGIRCCQIEKRKGSEVSG